jgi:hypothetical protein
MISLRTGLTLTARATRLETDLTAVSLAKTFIRIKTGKRVYNDGLI